VNVLEEIIEGVRADLAQRQAVTSLEELKSRARAQPSAKDGVRALRGEGFSDAPGDRMIIGDAHDQAALTLHQVLHYRSIDLFDITTREGG